MKVYLSILGRSFLFLCLMSCFFAASLLILSVIVVSLNQIHANYLILPFFGAGLVSGLILSLILACKVMMRFERSIGEPRTNARRSANEIDRVR